MAVQTTRMTRKGQITIPVAIREALDIHEGDVLVAERRENEIVLIRQQDVVDWTSGYLHEYAMGRHLGPQEIRKTAAQAIADQVASELDS